MIRIGTLISPFFFWGFVVLPQAGI